MSPRMNPNKTLSNQTPNPLPAPPNQNPNYPFSINPLNPAPAAQGPASMGPWTGGVTDAAAQMNNEDPMSQQMRLLRELRSKLLYPAYRIENDELAIQMSNAASMAEIARNLGYINAALGNIASTLAASEAKARGVGTMASLDDLRKVFENSFNIVVQAISAK